MRMQTHLLVNLNIADRVMANGYSNDELMKFAAHATQMTLTRDWISSITAVDGLASFLRLPLRSYQAGNLRSMTVGRNLKLLVCLPPE